MKWIDYTALLTYIIGAIVWGLIGVFQFNLVSFFFGENSWFSDSFMTSSAYPVLFTYLVWPNRTRYKHMYFVPLFYTLTIFIF